MDRRCRWRRQSRSTNRLLSEIRSGRTAVGRRHRGRLAARRTTLSEPGAVSSWNSLRLLEMVAGAPGIQVELDRPLGLVVQHGCPAFFEAIQVDFSDAVSCRPRNAPGGGKPPSTRTTSGFWFGNKPESRALCKRKQKSITSSVVTLAESRHRQSRPVPPLNSNRRVG